MDHCGVMENCENCKNRRGMDCHENKVIFQIQRLKYWCGKYKGGKMKYTVEVILEDIGNIDVEKMVTEKLSEVENFIVKDVSVTQRN